MASETKNQPERHEELPPSGEREQTADHTQEKGEAIVEHAMASTNALPSAQKQKDSLEGMDDQLPNAEYILKVILELGHEVYDKSSGPERTKAWDAYLRCVNEFRATYGNLPPIQKARSDFRFQIGQAMERRDAGNLLRIFNQEKSTIEHPWRTAFGAVKKEMKGVVGGIWNKITGVKTQAIDLGVGIKEIGRHSFIAYVPGIADSPEEARESKKLLSTIADSFHDFNEVAATVLHVDEYNEAVKQGMDSEAMQIVQGKMYFDAALAMLGGHIIMGFGKGAKALTKAALKGVQKTTVNAAKVTSGAALLAATESAEFLATEVAGGAGKTAIKSALKKGAEKAGEKAAEKSIHHGAHSAGSNH